MSEENKKEKSATQEFVDKFEALAEEYGVERYVASMEFEGRPIMLWRPKSLTEATKIAKFLHRNLYQQVMIEIGEVTPPSNVS